MTDEDTVKGEISYLQNEIGVVDALLLTNREGKILGSAGFRDSIAWAKDWQVQDALDGSGSHSIHVQGQDIYLSAVQPLIIGDYVQGTFGIYVRLDNERLRQLKGDANYELALVRGNQVAASTVPLKTVSGHTAGEPWRVSLDGKDYLATYAPLPESLPSEELGFVVLRNEAELLSPFRTLTWTFLGSVFLVMLTSLALGDAFARSTAARISRLVDYTNQLRDGDWPDLLAQERSDEFGVLTGTFNSMAASLKASQERLLTMIDVDPLTGLDNHRRFRERLDQEAMRTGKDGLLTLLLVDIREFQEFNNRYGHSAGDQKLREVASKLQALLPDLGFAARYSADQFAVAVPDVSAAQLGELFEGLRSLVTQVELCAGAAEIRSAKGKAESLVVAAEIALRRAKEIGKGQFSEFGSVPGADDADPIRLLRLMRDGTYATIRALAAAVDAKDPYTHGHSERVAQYAYDLAEYMGADPALRDQIHRCGTLHDVGKIGVPDAVLSKAGPLDEAELKSIQTHSVLGEYIVSKVPQLSDLLAGVRHHHERYDGTGYPDGLAGEAIPLVARYLAIADTYDAMTSDRPYRSGVPHETALAEIDAQAARQFDPILARAFTRMMRQGKRVA